MDRKARLIRDVSTKLTEIRNLDEQEREKVRRKIRGVQRKFMRANRDIDFGRVPPRVRVELAERVSDFRQVVKSFDLDDSQLYGNWKVDFDVATMNLTAFLKMLLRDYEVVKIQHLIIRAEIGEREGGETDE